MIKLTAAITLLLGNVDAFAPMSQPFVSKGVNTAGVQGIKNENTKLMCGLVAAIDDLWSNDEGVYPDIPLLNNNEKKEDDNLILKTTTDILYHRGPDGMTCSSGTIGDVKARWSMGHTRLAIVDPNNRFADQPFQLDFNVDGVKKHVKVAANGEIYNHEKIYSDMKADGWDHDRISGSDCEVIAHSFAKYGGPETAAKLDGMFAFVIFEESEDGSVKAFAARDPVGIKPIYYGRSLKSTEKEDASGYVFSSELKGLVGHVDPESVVAIPPGHYWTPEEGLVCYYNPDWLRKVRSMTFSRYSFPK
jgi:asparagine synthase (glutamine-hydrolysing)